MPGAGFSTFGRLPPPRPERGVTHHDRIQARISRIRTARHQAEREKRERREATKQASSRTQAQFSNFTPEVREVVAKSLGEILDKGLRTGNEHAIALHSDGTKVNGTLQGEKDSADVGALMAEGPDILIHNHPTSSSLSGADLAQFYTQPALRHLLVIGHNGTLYRMSKTDDTPAGRNPNEIVHAWNTEMMRLMPKYSPKVRSGELSASDASIQHTHEINIMMAGMYKLDYERILPSGEHYRINPDTIRRSWGK